jgi:hypothetical protein
MVVMFFLSNLLTVPLAVQDMIMQMATTTATGYTILLHWQLYQIYPVLIAIPTLLLAAVLHFFVQSGKSQAKVEMAKMLKGSQEREKEENEKKKQRKEKKRKEIDGLTARPGKEDVENQTNRSSIELSSGALSISSSSDSLSDSLPDSFPDNAHSVASADYVLSSSSNDSETEDVLEMQDYAVVSAPSSLMIDHFPSAMSAPFPVHTGQRSRHGPGHVNRRQSLQQGITALKHMECTVTHHVRANPTSEDDGLLNLHQTLPSLSLSLLSDRESHDERKTNREEAEESDSSTDSDDAL